MVGLWLNANFRTGYQKQKFSEKPGAFDFIKREDTSFQMHT